MLSLEEVKEYDDKQVTDEQYDKIIESEAVVEVENLGVSGRYPYCTWFIVKLIDGTEVNIYE